MYQKTKKEKEAAEAERAKFNKKGKTFARGERPSTPEVIRVPEDIKIDPKFEGQTIFMLEKVPLKCRDGVTLVDAKSIRDWIVFALVDDDPLSQPFYNKIAKITNDIEEIDELIKKIPKLEFLDEKQKPYPLERARNERAILFTKFNNERLKKEEEGEKCQKDLEAHIRWRKSMGVDLIQGEIDENTQTCIWFVKLHGQSDSKGMEDLLLKKEDWPGINLACGLHNGDPIVPTWVGRDKLVPDGSKANDPTDYRPLQVSMGAVRLSRVPAGVGLMKSLDRPSSDIYNDEFGLYYGEFEAGKKYGYGIEIDDVGIFAGAYENDRKLGRGRWDLCDGTTIVGNFGVTLHRSNIPECSGFINPYKDGIPNGLVEINFGDGGLYRGQMLNGRIIGHGDYQSAMNEVVSGPFENGILHGEKCFVENQVGEVYLGDFYHGEMQGYGTYHNKRGDSYEGFWDHHMKHGYGIHKLSNTGCYRGYYINNLKHGKGSLEYGLGFNKLLRKRMDAIKLKSKELKSNRNNHVTVNENKLTSSEDIKIDTKVINENNNKEVKDIEHELSEYDSIFQGFFVGNGISNCGSVMNTMLQVPTLISRLDKRLTYPITNLLRKEIRRQKVLDVKLEQYTDMECHIRDELQKKKIRIYNQQKHYTKKTMYMNEDSQYKLTDNQIESKLFLRKERLKMINPISHPYTKAMVPRLKIPRDTMNNTFNNAFENIKINIDGHIDKDQQVNEKLVKMIISDFDEIQERQRFLKYDLIWQRAENAYNRNLSSVV